MRLIASILLGLILILSAGTVLAAVSASGTFVTVTGNVQIMTQKGHHKRPAQVGSAVVEGQRVVTDKDSSAVLQFFDGSQLTIKPSTDFWLSKLQQPSDTDKILQFKMFAGNLFAKVTKLASTNSSFEIEAGGVVCGVRGTEFSMNFDADTKTLTLTVTEGSVFTDINGTIIPYGVGTQITFVNGVLQGLTSPATGNPGTGPHGNDLVITDLNDLEQQFGSNISINGDNIFHDPAVAGSSNLGIIADVPGQEVQSTVNVSVNVNNQEATYY